MNQSSFTAITAMVNAFPQSGANAKALLLTYEQALTGVGDAAVDEACRRFIAGDVQGQSKTFAPSIAEFVTEARSRQEIADLIARPRLAARGYVQASHLRPFEILRQKALTKFQDCPIIKENVSHTEFMAMSKAREVPVGGGWCAATTHVYGPPFEEISLGRKRAAA